VTVYPLSSCPPHRLLPCETLSASPGCVNSTMVRIMLPRISQRPASQSNQSLCVAHLHPPSASPSSPTLATLILSLLVPMAGHPSIPPCAIVPRLPRVSRTRMNPCPLHTPLLWVALQELPLPPLQTLLTSTGIVSLEIWLRVLKLICPGSALSPPSGLRFSPPPLVLRQPSGHLQYNPSMVPAVLPMAPHPSSVL